MRLLEQLVEQLRALGIPFASSGRRSRRELVWLTLRLAWENAMRYRLLRTPSRLRDWPGL
ncbi:hypothetical protein NW805_05455 [Synechococcus sp. W60.1]|uniref:hypothetical protein n=1 Tax=Synechococcus sp. W60.1 TaxID=2964516 RepID=UPI0039C1EE5A